eukprot:SAG11_NODE_134_length_15338_cov_3.876435_3_plen_71_part_00
MQMTVDDTIAGIAAVAALVRERLPASRLLLVAVLPRTDKGHTGVPKDVEAWMHEIGAPTRGSFERFEKRL